MNDLTETPLWQPTKFRRRYERNELARTMSFGRARIWRCKQTHRPTYQLRPMSKAGEQYWELLR